LQQIQYVAGWKSGMAVSWRAISWAEYRQFAQSMEHKLPMEVYIDLYRAVLLDGPDITEAPAGIVEFVGKAMLERNPFGGSYDDIKNAVDAKRNTQDFLENAKTLIAGLFRYTFEEIDTWDADTFFDRYAKAEFLSGKQLDPVKMPTPEELAAAIEAKKHPQKRPRPPKKEMTAGQKLAWDRVQSNQR
jgi:hypothetical protein